MEGRKTLYMVDLPSGFQCSGGGDVPRRGYTKANSPRQAVTFHVANYVSKERIGLVVSGLDNGARMDGFTGVEAFAYAFPYVETDNGTLNARERRIAREVFLAQEIALARRLAGTDEKLDPVKFQGLAKTLLDDFYNALRTQRLRLAG